MGNSLLDNSEMIAAHSAQKTWRIPLSGRLTRTQRYWMKRPGALTAGLRSLGAFKLRVTREFADTAQGCEAHALRIRTGTPVWVREVVMSVDGKDCVSARSITPLHASKGIWSGIRRLRTRPLADMLYGDSDIRRSLFEWRQLSWGDPFWHAVWHFGGAKPLTPPGSKHNTGVPPAQTHAHTALRWPTPRLASHPQLLARRSVFWRQRQPLLVAECFLPAFWEIAMKHLTPARAPDPAPAC